MGQEDEAEKIYQQFLETNFSKTPEGKINANEFLTAAGRWDEAAFNYRSLDAMFEGKDAYTIDNIRNYALKKYKTNLQAGRLDSAMVVSRLICDSLDHAFNLAKEIDAEEQIVIIDKIEQLTQQQAETARQRQMGLFVLLGILFLCFIAYAIYRSYRGHKLNKAHTELKADYTELEERTVEKARTQTLQTTALDAQKALLPAPLPKRKDLTVLATLTSGTALSSDLYDYLIRDEQLFFCIGSAHGDTIQSSVQMAMAWSQFRTAAAITNTPGLILSAINRSLATIHGDKPVVDLFVGVLNLTTGQLDYSQAGAISPLLMENDEVTVLPIETTPAAGSEETASFFNLQTEVAPGAMLYLYTPGVAAVTNAEGKIYGEKRLRGTTLQALKLNSQPAAFLANITEALKNFTGSEQQATDQTMLLIRRN
jgi:serine phosphatase RsbU (regulator of sigma subunit)